MSFRRTDLSGIGARKSQPVSDQAPAANPGLSLDRSSDDLVADLQARLEQAERLALLGMVAMEIAHEFNNLLTPVGSYAEMALDRPGDSALTRKALERAREGAARAGEIARAILELGVGGSAGRVVAKHGAARHVDTMGGCRVVEAVEGALRCMARDLGKDGIVLRVEVPGELRVAAELVVVQQVVMNLVINARRAILQGRKGVGGGGSSLVIRARAAGGDDECAARHIHRVATSFVDCMVLGLGVVLEVVDSGVGMDEAGLARARGRLAHMVHEDRAHQHLAQGHRAHEEEGRGGEGGGGGWGVGLGLCGRLIAAAGGRAWVESAVGEGTVVGVWWPGVG